MALDKDIKDRGGREKMVGFKSYPCLSRKDDSFSFVLWNFMKDFFLSPTVTTYISWHNDLTLLHLIKTCQALFYSGFLHSSSVGGILIKGSISYVIAF